MSRLSRLLLGIFFTVLLLTAPMFAQKTSGTIEGQITDSVGAVVPNVPVTITNSATGSSRTVNTNASGEYSATDVPIGLYKVSVQATGFKQFVAQNVELHVDSTVKVNAQLQVGGASEQVTVEATGIQVQTDSAALGEVVGGTQVRELPLNGRSFVQLTQLQPGVSGANNFDGKNKGLQGGVDFSVNGNPTTNNLFLVDGANDNDVGSNRTILIYPSIESIAEFKMLRNSYGAEYGQASGGVITIATRSGTNQFHGTAFYSGRNDALAAHSYFAARATAIAKQQGTILPHSGKDKVRRNDWGYSIGGPVVHDKLFFFFSEEWNHEIRGKTVSACVPTAAEIAGDFTTVSCGETQPTFTGPNARSAHVLNTVDPVGQLLTKKYPLPNLNTPVNGANWTQSLPSALFWRQENGRADFNLNHANAIMFRYTQDAWSNPSYNAGYWGDDPFPALNSSWSQPSKMIIGRWTSTISSSLVNDAEFAYSNNRINITPGGSNPGLLGQLSSSFPTLYPNSLKNSKQGAPQIWGGLGNYGSNNNYQAIAPWNNTLDLYTIRDDVSKAVGRHSLKFGVFLGYDGKNEDTSTSSSERLTFQTTDGSIDVPTKDKPNATGVATGNNLANVLIPNNPFLLNETSTNVRAQLRWRDYEFYAADTFKVTPRFTLDVGFRYSLLSPTFQPKNQLTNFQPSLYDPSKPASDACNGLWVVPGTDPCGAANAKFGTHFSSGTPGPNKYLVHTNNHLIAPRIGVAYDVSGNGVTVIRAGVGEFFQRERISRYTLAANAPFAVNVNNYSRTLGGATPASLSGAGASPGGGFDPSAVLPASWQWNLTVERSFAKETALQVSYVGNLGQNLTSSYDVNTIPQQNWNAASFLGGDAQKALRPYNHDSALTYFSHDGTSNYNALQTSFRTKYRRSQLGAAYTWSHSIANVVLDDSSGGTGSQSFTYYPNKELDRGSSTINRPQIFVANVTYFLPDFATSGHLVRSTLGGWETSAIVTSAMGNSFTVYQNGVSENQANVVFVPGTGADIGKLVHPAGTGSLNALFQTGLTGPQRPLMNPSAGSCRSGISGSQVINPQAVTLVGYTIGTIPSNTAPRGYCHGPTLNNTDLSVDKNWKVAERLTVQFRMDFFDLFNHANFRGDQINATALNNVNCGAANGAGLYQPCTSSNNVVTSQTRNAQFGQASGVVGNAGRELQYGLHLTF